MSWEESLFLSPSSSNPHPDKVMQVELPKDELHVSEKIPTTEPQNDAMDLPPNRLSGFEISYARSWMDL